jgi:hypothetical protein
MARMSHLRRHSVKMVALFRGVCNSSIGDAVMSCIRVWPLAAMINQSTTEEEEEDEEEPCRCSY